MATLLGALTVVLGGLLQGSGIWPMKMMKKFEFEHWWFVAMLVGLVIAPWGITLTCCPNAWQAYHDVQTSTLVKANLCALAWGVANILCGLCFVRIGVALTGGILAGLGVSVGVTVPMVVKGTGLFREAPNLGSPAANLVLFGVAIMLVGVVLAAFAGFGRDRVLKKSDQPRSGGFLGGLIMVTVAGILSAGMSFAFVYSQGPIVAAMKAHGAGEIPANFAVWAMGLFAGAVINVAYPAYLMTKRHSWGILREHSRELAFAVVMGANFILAVFLMGKGMLLLGPLGASVGFGVQQAMQMLGSQGVGFASGEWRLVSGKPRHQMYAAITVLIIAAVVMAYSNVLAKA